MNTIKTKLLSYNRALKATELADIFCLDKMTIYKHTRENRIPCFRVGTSVRYDPAMICEWFDKQLVEG